MTDASGREHSDYARPYPPMGTPLTMTDGRDLSKEMTKRELFAAMAMQGLCASDRYESQAFESTSWVAVRQADALIAELNKEQGV